MNDSASHEDLLDLNRRIADELVKVLFEVTIFPAHMTVEDFERIIEIFLAFCPKGQMKNFKIAELPAWSSLAAPALTQSGREARSLGRPRPYFEPVRKRIRESRAFSARLWDGRGIEDPNGSWSLSIHCEKFIETGNHFYARVLLPLQTSPDVLVALARQLADEINMLSGHGGPVFVFDPVLPYAAFTQIYRYSRRYLGIDIDMLDVCLGRMKKRLKSPCWINMIGYDFARANDIPPPPELFFRNFGIHTERRGFANLHIIAGEPALLDVNRPAERVAAYHAYNNYIADFMLTEDEIGNLNGEGFLNEEGSSGAWLQRFEDGAV